MNSLFVTWLLLGIGLSVLLIGGHYLVESGVALAERFHLPEFLVGLTVLTIGTSLPELFVSVTGGLQQLTQAQLVGNLILGEIIGSAVGQIGLVLGLAGIFGTLRLPKAQLRLQSFALVGSVIAVWLLGLDRVITRADAGILLGLYAGYLMLLARVLPRKKIAPETYAFPLWLTLGQLGLGLAMLLGGARLVVVNGVSIAEATQLSQSLVGILVIGLGTSLPELVVAVTASAKKAQDLSVGNIIGSNIFDVMVALSAGALLSDFQVEANLIRFDLPILLFISVITMLFFVSQGKLQRRESWLLVGLYLAYASLKVVW